MENGPAGQDPLAELVSGVASGDEAALRSLYDELGPLVLGLATSILREESEAEETLVDVFVQVWRQAERYERSRGTVVAWIAMLARTRAIDRRRRRARDPAADGLESQALPATGPSPAEAFQGALDRERMRRAVDSLPSEQRRAIEAAFYGGLSHSEVARELGEPLGTIKSRIRAGLAALRRNLSTLTGEIA